MGTVGIREILRLIPFLLSDGGVSPKGINGWTIYLRNNDLEIINEFRSNVKKAINKRPSLIKRKDGTFMVRIDSVELGNLLLKFSPTYRTSKRDRYPACPGTYGGRCVCKTCETKEETTPAKIPEEIFADIKLAKYFLKVYASCDGGVSVTVTKKEKYKFLVRKVFISVTHPKIKSGLIRLLNLLGFRPKHYEGQIRLTSKEDLEKFRKIGFIDGCKIGKDSKILSGMEKNLVLEKMISSYGYPSELIKFLQNRAA